VIRGLLLITLAGCSLDPEGEWTGQCLTTDHELRVRLRIRPSDDDSTLVADAILHQADRPGESLTLVCDEVEQIGKDVAVDDCFGFWTASGDPQGPHDFAVSGVIEDDEPMDTMGGRCVYEGGDGPLDLVRTLF
jgi:hypothetical protein